MSDLRFPSGWLRIDEAAVALGLAEDQAEHYSKIDYWRAALDETGRKVFALEDVRATVKSLRFIEKRPPEPKPKVDRRRGARPKWMRLGRHA